jgi:thiosulfate dehydrogenase [quinone] large subunit
MSVDNREMEAELFGRETNFEYSENAIGYALVAMRLTMGWILLQGGLTKVVTYLDADPSNDWTAAGFLANAIPAGNPFEGAFAAMAGNPLVDALVMAGLTLTGIGVVLGAALRWNAFWGAVMMLLFWAASLQGGLAAGLPVAHGFVVDSHLVYAALLFGLGAAGAGRVFGVDAVVERLRVVREHAALRYLLG